jgi:2-hydroxychromene-2-carboxylate isomerase
MSLTIDYYFAPSSPWTYLGHQRLAQILKLRDVNVSLLPIDLGGQVFPATGGLPVSQRSVQRQSYRLLELKRFSEFLKMPLNLNPQYFPVSSDLAAKLIIAVQKLADAHVAMQISASIMRGVWVEQKNIADEAYLQILLGKHGIRMSVAQLANEGWVQAQYEQNTAQAIEVGVFGSPSYVIDQEIFWGQDRLDFLDRRIKEKLTQLFKE